LARLSGAAFAISSSAAPAHTGRSRCAELGSGFDGFHYRLENWMNQNEAEKQIAVILAQLEMDNDALVEAVRVQSLEVTNLNSPRPEHSMRVIIDLQRRPGRSWGGVEATTKATLK
jgi:hypothetical protein